MVTTVTRQESTPERDQVRDAIDAPRPTVPRLSARSMLKLHPLLEPNRLWYRLALLLESTPALYRAFTWIERRVKNREFGCRMCGQCALPSTAYACPQTCPKQLRNGPCGGVSAEGRCEVYPDLRCVWVVAYERAEQEGRIADLRRLQRPIDHRRWGESSWVNYWRGRDEHLWTAGSGLDSAELPFVERGRESTHTALGGGAVASGSVGVSSAVVTDSPAGEVSALPDATVNRPG